MGHAQRNKAHHMGIMVTHNKTRPITWESVVSWGTHNIAQPDTLECGVSWGTHNKTRPITWDSELSWGTHNETRPITLESGVSWGTHNKTLPITLESWVSWGTHNKTRPITWECVVSEACTACQMGEWGIMWHAQPNMTHHMGECGIRGMHSLSNGRVGYHGARTTKHDPSHGRVWYQRHAQPVKWESGVSWGTHNQT